MAFLIEHLPQHAACQAVFSFAQINQNQAGIHGLQLRRQRACDIGQRHKTADDERHGRNHFLRLPVLPLPLRAHRERIFAHGDADIQRGAQLHAHGFHGFIQRRVFARFATGSHPVGREFDFFQFNRRGQQIGDGFRHRHAA